MTAPTGKRISRACLRCRRRKTKCNLYGLTHAEATLARLLLTYLGLLVTVLGSQKDPRANPAIAPGANASWWNLAGAQPLPTGQGNKPLRQALYLKGVGL
jgi:hypothetical protein